MTTKREREEQEERASTIAARHLISPDADKLVEVSYLPIGITHSLTMIQAFEEQMDTMIEQIRASQLWHVRKTLARKYDEYGKVAVGEGKEKETRLVLKKSWEENSEAKEIYNKLIEIGGDASLEKLDPLEPEKLFIHRFRHAYYQTSRGKEGKFIDSLTILADTDLQTRSTDMENAFRGKIRGQ